MQNILTIFVAEISPPLEIINQTRKHFYVLIPYPPERNPGVLFFRNGYLDEVFKFDLPMAVFEVGFIH